MHNELLIDMEVMINMLQRRNSVHTFFERQPDPNSINALLLLMVHCWSCTVPTACVREVDQHTYANVHIWQVLPCMPVVIIHAYHIHALPIHICMHACRSTSTYNYMHTPAAACAWLSPNCTTGSITTSSSWYKIRWRFGTNLFFLRHAIARYIIRAIPHVLSNKQNRTMVEPKSADAFRSQVRVQLEFSVEATAHRIQSVYRH